jgi:hypothetical protein
MLLNPAEGLQAAPLAGLRIFAWVYLGLSFNEVPGKLLDAIAPSN